MKKFYAALLTACTSLGTLSAQAPEEEKGYIKEMCGCYEVEFKYAETFSDATDYQLHDPYSSKGLEWIFVDEEDSTHLILQHLLIVGGGERVSKHWRQDWFYENLVMLQYQKNLEWKKTEITAKEAKGTWTQKVYQVDDSPRYEGYATWIDVDGKLYWESQVAAPLPRREFTKRDDYNVMLRNNKHKITKTGHVHELDNAKVIRTADGDSVLVWEKGMNSYFKVEDSRCEAAQAWWEANKTYWRDVRMVWDNILSEQDYINLEYMVDDQKLWQRLFDLGDEMMAKKKYRSEKAQKEVRAIIESYLSANPTPWVSAETEAEKAY